jgi:hypothetical protein
METCRQPATSMGARDRYTYQGLSAFLYVKRGVMYSNIYTANQY